MNQTITEVPGLHLAVYFTYDLYDKSTGRYFTDHSDNEILKDIIYKRDILQYPEKFDNIMKSDMDHFTIRCYDQNLQVGDGTTNSIQLEQVFDKKNIFLKSILDNGSKTRKYEYGHYLENVDVVFGSNGIELYPVAKVSNTEHIGMFTDNLDMTGVTSFTNINVPYEKHNGITFIIP